MTISIDRVSPKDDIVAIASRATLYAVLLSALGHQKQPQVLPRSLYADLNVPPPPEGDLHSR
jgi:hypothetical protein